MSDYLHLLKKEEATREKTKEIEDQMIKSMDKEYKISKNRNYMSYDPRLKF